MIISLQHFGAIPKQGNPINIDPASTQGGAQVGSGQQAPAPAPPAAPSYAAPQSYSHAAPAPSTNYAQPMQYGSSTLPADLPPVVPVAALNPYQQKWTIKVPDYCAAISLNITRFESLRKAMFACGAMLVGRESCSV